MIFCQILRVSISNLNVTRSFIVSSRSAKVKSGITVKRYVKGLLFGAAASSIIYDGFNGFEVAGGFSRFLRSLKIAATISFDYSWNLYGLENGTELYDQVNFNFNLFFIGLMKFQIQNQSVPSFLFIIL